MSVHTKKRIPPHTHFQTEIEEVRQVRPNRPAYKVIHATNVIVDSTLRLSESIMASPQSQGTTFPTNPIHGQVFLKTDEGIAYRYHDVFGWLPLDYTIVNRIASTLATRSKPTYILNDGTSTSLSASWDELTELREEYRALAEFKHVLFALECWMRHTTGGGNYCQVKVTKQLDAGAEDDIIQWSTNSMTWVEKTWDGEIKSDKNQKLTIRWYMRNIPSGVATAEMKDAKQETRGIEYREDIA